MKRKALTFPQRMTGTMNQSPNKTSMCGMRKSRGTSIGGGRVGALKAQVLTPMWSHTPPCFTQKQSSKNNNHSLHHCLVMTPLVDATSTGFGDDERLALRALGSTSVHTVGELCPLVKWLCAVVPTGVAMSELHQENQTKIKRKEKDNDNRTKCHCSSQNESQ